MEAPPLIRSIRHMLQSQRHLAARPLFQHGLRTAQCRPNSSVAAKPPTAPRNLELETKATTPPTDSPAEPRLPRSLQTLYLKPLRRECEYGVPTADLQLRSYSKRSIEFFCDFALRAAYYLGLPAFGPVPLPRITERWTVPKSNFIFKKSQENFERITLRRLIQIRDGHPDVVQVWLAFLQKHAYPGVGMKANVWEFSKLGVGKMMDEAMVDATSLIEPEWAHLGESRTRETVAKAQELLAGMEAEAAAQEGGKAAPPDPEAVEKVKQLLATERVRAAGGR